MTYYTLVLDVIIAALLVATIVYAGMLNRRLNVLRKNRDEMAKLISQFNEATVRAETSIPKLRKAAEDAGQGLQERVEKAHALRDDLAFMIERADTMADRLENAVRTGRNEMKAAPAATGTTAGPATGRPAGAGATGRGPAPSPLRQAIDGVDEDERSEAERELLRALQSVR